VASFSPPAHLDTLRIEQAEDNTITVRCPQGATGRVVRRPEHLRYLDEVGLLIDGEP
jgi:hypothetical protein